MGKTVRLQTSSRLEGRQGWRARPLIFWVLWFGYAFFSLAGWVRLFDTVVDWYWLSFAGIHPGPLYLAITGLLWGTAGLVPLIWMWQRWPWARAAALIVALFFALTYWLDRLLFRTAFGSGGNALFALLITALALAYVYAALRPLDELRALWKRWI